VSEEVAKKRLNWLLGKDDDLLRSRKYLLGDIVNADPAYAGMNNQSFNKLPAKYGAHSYLTYVRKKSQQTPLLFANANDGMMHAFDAKTGVEVFAYIPRGAYPKLNGLMEIDFEHEYIVDGSLYVGDAYLNGTWRTLVVGSLGYGGRGIFALDVTDTLNDASKKPTVIFDFTNTDRDSPIRKDIGFILNKPVIVPTHDGSWHVISGNGVNSSKGTAKLLLIDLNDPLDEDETFDIDTVASKGGSNDNGLSGAALLPNSSGITTYAYGGDILGNVWKFDLSDNDSEDWDVAYKNRRRRPKPLITVVDDENNAQPITTVPAIGYNYLLRSSNDSNKYAVMVYFVTGKFYTSEDSVSERTQSIYAIADTGYSLDLNWRHRTQFLHQKEISKQTASKRTIANDKNVDWTQKKGWFLDLVSPEDEESDGERGISKPLLLYNRLVFTTYVPSSNQCDFGGTGWLMELNAVNGVYNDEVKLLAELGNSFLETAIISDISPLVGKYKLLLIASSLGDGEGEPKLNRFEVSIDGIKGRVSWRESGN
jgi:type IV pilus assembly protein PilY1